MSKGRVIATCSVCNIQLKSRGQRGGQKTKYVICQECAKPLEKQCARCDIVFLPSSTRGTRFSYCIDCARFCNRQYKIGQPIRPSLNEKECLYCLMLFQPLQKRSKCCSHSCNTAHNAYMKSTGKIFRSSDLILCKCGKLISNQYKSCSVCKSAECSVDLCEMAVRLNGLCNKHYLRLKRHGDLEHVRQPQPRRPRCSIEYCDEAGSKDGLCLHHWRIKSRPPKLTKLCSHPGCEKKHEAQGFCNFHYRRHLNGVDLDAPKNPNKKYFNDLCLEDQCNKPNARQGHGLCKTHLRKRRRIIQGRYGKGISWQMLGPRVNWVCHLCGEQVEQIAGTWETPQGANVDHLVPRSKGGTDDWDNVLLAHYSCNHSRSNKDIKKKDLDKKIDDARFASLDKVFQ